VSATGVGALLGLTAFGVISLGEGERRAARISFILAAAISLPCFVVAALPPPAPLVGAAFITIAAVAAVVLWFVPVARLPTGGGRPSRRVDERDIMFARGRLVPGSPEYESYYAMRPQNKQGDDHTRLLPGLLSADCDLRTNRATTTPVCCRVCCQRIPSSPSRLRLPLPKPASISRRRCAITSMARWGRSEWSAHQKSGRWRSGVSPGASVRSTWG